MRSGKRNRGNGDENLSTCKKHSVENNSYDNYSIQAIRSHPPIVEPTYFPPDALVSVHQHAPALSRISHLKLVLQMRAALQTTDELRRICLLIALQMLDHHTNLSKLPHLTICLQMKETISF